MANRRGRRFWLLPLVIATHLGIGIAMYASGIWGIERLDGSRRFGEIGVMAPPPPPAGGGSPPAAVRRAIEPKVHRKITPALVQPVPKQKDEKLAGLLSGTEEGRGIAGTGKGIGTGSGDGPCTSPPCGDLDGLGDLKVPEVPRPPAISTLTPTEIAERRIFGETQIEPSQDDRADMSDANKRVVSGTFQIAVSATGVVTGVQIIKTTGYPEYDRRLVAAMYNWRYRPYSIDGTAQPFRGMIRFDYKLGRR
jgi:TonB family protein